MSSAHIFLHWGVAHDQGSRALTLYWNFSSDRTVKNIEIEAWPVRCSADGSQELL